MPLKSIILGDSKVTVVLGTLDQELRSVLVQEVRDSLGKTTSFLLAVFFWGGSIRYGLAENRF